jgi:hypothetical protein
MHGLSNWLTNQSGNSQRNKNLGFRGRGRRLAESSQLASALAEELARQQRGVDRLGTDIQDTVMFNLELEAPGAKTNVCGALARFRIQAYVLLGESLTPKEKRRERKRDVETRNPQTQIWRQSPETRG